MAPWTDACGSTHPVQNASHSDEGERCMHRMDTCSRTKCTWRNNKAAVSQKLSEEHEEKDRNESTAHRTRLSSIRHAVVNLLHAVPSQTSSAHTILNEFPADTKPSADIWCVVAGFVYMCSTTAASMTMRQRELLLRIRNWFGAYYYGDWRAEERACMAISYVLYMTKCFEYLFSGKFIFAYCGIKWRAKWVSSSASTLQSHMAQSSVVDAVSRITNAHDNMNMSRAVNTEQCIGFIPFRIFVSCITWLFYEFNRMEAYWVTNDREQQNSLLCWLLDVCISSIMHFDNGISRGGISSPKTCRYLYIYSLYAKR